MSVSMKKVVRQAGSVTLHEHYDNSFVNIGNHNSFVWYGPEWAQASTAVGSLYKGYSTEGGIKVPGIVRYPGFASTKQQGSLVNAFATVMDIAPTVLDLAGVQHPVPSGEKKGQWRSRQVYGMMGKSLVPFMSRSAVAESDATEAIHGEDDPAWKLVHLGHNLQHGTGDFELYDLSLDPGERRNLAADQPGVVQDRLERWETYLAQTGTIWGGFPERMGGMRDEKARAAQRTMSSFDSTLEWMSIKPKMMSGRAI